MTTNLPPGCSSTDGGIDHTLETALETLCEKIDSVEVANLLGEVAITLNKHLRSIYLIGVRDGRQEAAPEKACLQDLLQQIESVDGTAQVDTTRAKELLR